MMQPIALDFSRIQNETGADKVVMTSNNGCVIQCDLYFIKNGRGFAFQAEFDMTDEEQLLTACDWVKFELGARLYTAMDA